jgi:23S rRNA (pseudouridine1915-N3)-methyltransferase
LAARTDQDIPSAAFVAGDPDGLEPAFLASASLTLSLGAMTWPHQLVRIMAAEQIYRAVTVPSGHPLSSQLIRERAGVLPRRRHFPLLLDVMR